MAVSAEEDRPKDSATTTEASAEEKEYTMHPRDQIRRLRWWVIDDGPKGSTTTTEALTEKDYTKDFNNGNKCVGGG